MVTRKGNNVAKKLATKYPFGLRVSISKFWVFFFFLSAWTVKSHEFTVQETKNHYSCTIAAMFMYCSSTVNVFKNIKNESHGTIHTFKNYCYSTFSFQLSVSTTITSTQTDPKSLYHDDILCVTVLIVCNVQY